MRVRWLFIAVALGAMPALAPAQGQRGRDTDDDSRSRIDTTFAFDRTGSIDLELISGEIQVRSWDRAQIQVRATSESGVLDMEASSSHLSLDAHPDHGDMGDVHYEVTVPAGVRVYARAVSADVTVDAGGGEIEAHSVNGDVKVANGARRVTVESVSGGASAEHVSGVMRVTSVSGDVTVRDASGELEVSSVSGDITLTGIKATYLHEETVSGDVQFAGSFDPKGRYEFKSHSGDLRLELPAGGATFGVQTFSGDVDSSCPMTLMPNQRQGGKRMEFTVAGGGPRVSLTTFSGDVIIRGACGSARED